MSAKPSPSKSLNEVHDVLTAPSCPAPIVTSSHTGEDALLVVPSSVNTRQNDTPAGSAVSTTTELPVTSFDQRVVVHARSAQTST
jgi:hypothetical protein